MTDKWKGIPLLDDVTEMNRTGGNSTVGGVMMMTPKQKAHVIFCCLFRRPKRWCRLMMVDCCFQKKKNPKGSLPLTRNHTFSSAACLRVFFVFVLSWTMRCNLAVPLDFPVSYFLFFLIPICANLATLETQYLSHHLRNFSLDKWRRNVKQIKVTPYQRLQRCRVELNIAATFRKKNKKNWETNIKTMWRKTSPSHFLFINSWINNHFGNIKLKMRNLDLIKNKLLIHQTVDTFNVYDPLWIFFLFCFFQMI